MKVLENYQILAKWLCHYIVEPARIYDINRPSNFLFVVNSNEEKSKVAHVDYHVHQEKSNQWASSLDQKNYNSLYKSNGKYRQSISKKLREQKHVLGQPFGPTWIDKYYLDPTSPEALTVNTKTYHAGPQAIDSGNGKNKAVIQMKFIEPNHNRAST